MKDDGLYELETLAVHAGESEAQFSGAVTAPIFQTSTYRLDGDRTYDDIRYVRLNNSPNHLALAQKLSALEQAEAALVTGSGMAAISTAMLSHAKHGEHIVAQAQLYGGTRSLLDVLAARHGIELSFVAGDSPEAWVRAVRANTRLLYVEALTNPVLEVAPLDAVVRLARERGLTSVIDSTLATPMNFRAIPFGFDLVVHSATKYLNGHTDIAAGVIAGSKSRVHSARNLLNLMGGCLDPHACFLLQRGLKTLPLRVPRQNANALALARALRQDAHVAQVHYPGLESHPAHQRAKQWFRGFGALVSFVPRGGLPAAERLLPRLHLAQTAPSLGGLETLVCRPAISSHAGLSPQVRASMGIDDALIRVSVGIENEADLVEDFRSALRS